MDFKKIISFQIVELGLRIWTAFFVFVYGFAKPWQFEGANLVDTPIKDASDFEMMWAFFGTTTAFPIIIGCLEMIGAVLLLFRKTKLLAAVLLTPIFINIILMDIFYGVHIGALSNAIAFQLVLLIVVIGQRDKIKQVFHSLLVQKNSDFTWKETALKYILALIFAVAFLFAYEAYANWLAPY